MDSMFYFCVQDKAVPHRGRVMKAVRWDDHVRSSNYSDVGPKTSPLIKLERGCNDESQWKLPDVHSLYRVRDRRDETSYCEQHRATEGPRRQDGRAYFHCGRGGLVTHEAESTLIWDHLQASSFSTSTKGRPDYPIHDARS